MICPFFLICAMSSATLLFTALYLQGNIRPTMVNQYVYLITCIHFNRNMGAVRALIDRGADVDVKCHGTPPTHLAIATAVQPQGNDFGFECLSLLLENNANPLGKVRCVSL